MDYIEGGNLRQCIKEYLADKNKLKYYRSLIDIERFSFLRNKLIQLEVIVSGLNEIHAKGLVHKDFHAGNILGEESGNYDRAHYFYITDLGLCRPVNEIDHNKVYGVMSYVAPEVLRGQPYTQASDIYSFGIVAYELFANDYPYLEADDMELALKVCRGYRPNMDEIKVPQLLKDLIKQCWNADPKKRPSSEELCRIIDG